MKITEIHTNEMFAAEPFDYEQATINITIQIHPGAERQVVMAVNANNGSPLTTISPLSEVALPLQIIELLERLKALFPARAIQAQQKTLKPAVKPKIAPKNTTARFVPPTKAAPLKLPEPPPPTLF